MPTYRVDRAGHDLPRVVVAPMPSSARMHVAMDELQVRRIEVDEAFALAEQGVRLERAGETPPEFAEVDETGAAQQEDTSSTLGTVQQDSSQHEGAIPLSHVSV